MAKPTIWDKIQREIEQAFYELNPEFESKEDELVADLKTRSFRAIQGIKLKLEIEGYKLVKK